MSLPLARQIARFNRRVTNPLLGPLVWFLPGFGRIEHVGRRTGARYAAPMMAFRSRNGRRLTFALTYGREAQWVQNALAAGRVGFASRWTGRVELSELRVARDPARRAVPRAIGRVLRVLGVDEFLEGTIDRRDDLVPPAG